MCCALAIFFLLEARAGVFLAKGTTTLCIETLSLQIGLADSTVEAFSVPVLPESLHPAVRGFDGELAAVALGREELVPVLRAILIPVLNVEACGPNWRLTMETDKTFRMPRLAHSVDAVMFDGGDALGAFRREMRFVVDFAEKLTALFDKTAVLKRCAALRVGAHERIRGEGLTESQDEGPSDLVSTDGADWDFAGEDRLLHLRTSGGSQRRLPRPLGNGRHFGGCSDDRYRRWCWSGGGLSRFRCCNLSSCWGLCCSICSLRGGGSGDILCRVKSRRRVGSI